jgi:hypothetical protein
MIVKKNGKTRIAAKQPGYNDLQATRPSTGVQVDPKLSVLRSPEVWRSLVKIHDYIKKTSIFLRNKGICNML